MFNLFKKPKGCLYGKTEEQKNTFFASLAKFAIDDEAFFKEQYWDLLPEERDEFGEWVQNDLEMKRAMKSLVDVIGKLLPEMKSTNINNTK